LLSGTKLFVEEAVDADRYDLALAAANKLAIPMATKIKDADASKKIGIAKKRLGEQQRMYSSAAKAADVLKSDPGDAEANAKVGRFLCFVKGDWSRGLPFLVKADGDRAQPLAKQDVSQPSDPVQQAKLGDDWFAFESSSGHRAPALERAKYWYDLALPKLTGLTRAGVENHLKEMASLLDPPRTPKKSSSQNLFKLITENTWTITWETGQLRVRCVYAKDGSYHVNRSDRSDGTWTIQGDTVRLERPNDVVELHHIQSDGTMKVEYLEKGVRTLQGIETPESGAR
jgi:hypothetical protein